MVEQSQNRMKAAMLAAALGVSAAAASSVAQSSQTSPSTRPTEDPPGTAPATAPARDPRAPAEKLDRIAEVVARITARDHGYDTWRTRNAVQADVVVRFGDQTVIDGTLTTEVSGWRARLELKSGEVVVFDGSQATVSPATATLSNAEFNATMWPFLLTAALRTQQPGVKMTAYQHRILRSEGCTTFLLEFKPQLELWPDDWFLMFSLAGSHQLRAIASGTDFNPGEASDGPAPNLVIFDRHTLIDGVLFPSAMTFWHWSQEGGIEGEALGTGAFSNIKFVTPASDWFTKQTR